MKMKFEWEIIWRIRDVENTDRAKVICGWIIRNQNEYGDSMVFVPDPEHKWEIEFDDGEETIRLKNTSIDVLKIKSIRVLNILKHEKILTLYDLVNCKKIDLLKYPNFSYVSLKHVEDALNKIGLSLAD